MGFVSVVVPFDDRWYFRAVLSGARERIEQAGHVARLHVIAPTEVSTVQAADTIEADFADPDCLGAVIAGFRYRADQRARALTFNRPIVVVGGSVMGFPTVMIDDISAASMATQHLIELGHRRVVHFGGELGHPMDFLVDSRRAKGYRLAMERALLEPVVIENPFDHASVLDTARTLLRGPVRPSAIFAVSDEIAFPILDAAEELDLELGVDLSVTSIDDHPDAASRHLTTVRQRPDEMGTVAADMLLAGLDHGPDMSQSRLHPVGLVKRGSSGLAGRSRQPHPPLAS